MPSPAAPTPTDDQDALFCVVDEDDRLLGHRTRRECHADATLIHRSVYVTVETTAGRLWQRRGFGKDAAPGLWDLACAGHVDPGESYQDAAVRELAEELGMLGTRPVELGRLRLDLPGEREICTVFALRHDGPFALRLPEVAAIGVWPGDEEPAPLSDGAAIVGAWLRAQGHGVA